MATHDSASRHDLDTASIDLMNYRALQKKLKELGERAVGKKEELRERLKEYYNVRS